MYDAVQNGIGGTHAGSCENNRRLNLSVDSVTARFHIYQFLVHPERLHMALHDKYLVETFVYDKDERVAMEAKSKIVNKQKAIIRKDIISLKQKIATRVSGEKVKRVDAVRMYNNLCKDKDVLTERESKDLKALIDSMPETISLREVNESKYDVTNLAIRNYYCMFREGAHIRYKNPDTIMDFDYNCEDWVKELKV